MTDFATQARDLVARGNLVELQEVMRILGPVAGLDGDPSPSQMARRAVDRIREAADRIKALEAMDRRLRAQNDRLRAALFVVKDAASDAISGQGATLAEVGKDG